MHYKTPITDVQIEANFKHAAEQYAAFGVDIERAVDRALEVPISLHCWQGDDVAGHTERISTLLMAIRAAKSSIAMLWSPSTLRVGLIGQRRMISVLILIRHILHIPKQMMALP